MTALAELSGANQPSARTIALWTGVAVGGYGLAAAEYLRLRAEDAQRVRDLAEQQARAEAERRSRHEEEARRRAYEWNRQCERVVTTWPLPRVSEADPYRLRVFRSRRAEPYRGAEPWPPYAKRTEDATLRSMLQRKPFVLVEGPTRAGKSRTAFEAVRAVLPDRRLVIPVDRQSLRELDRLDPPIFEDEPAVVWLDDVDRFLGVEGEGLTADMLARWERAGVKTVATIRFRERDRLEHQAGAGVAEIFTAAEPVALDLDLRPDERADALRLYAGERFPRGLAEHLAGAEELRAVFDRGVETAPAGHAVVRAAADRRRAGLYEPVDDVALRDLFDDYFHQIRPVEEPSDELFAAGMAWAHNPVGGVAALLVRRRQPPYGLEVSEVIVDHLDDPARSRPVPEATWRRLLAQATAVEALAIGHTAGTRGEPGIALDAFVQAAGSDDSEAAPVAALHLGLLLQQRHDTAGAEDAYLRAIDSANPTAAGLASINLALLLDGRGERERAKGLLANAMQGRAESFMSTAAAMNLGIILAREGDTDGAAATLASMLERVPPEALPAMATNCGLLLQQMGDPEAAEDLLRRAIDDDADLVPAVAAAMVRIYGHQDSGIGGFLVSADRSRQSGQPKLPRISVVGVLRQPGPDANGAPDEFAHPTIDLSDPPDTVSPLIALGLVQERSDDLDAAQATYQRAFDAGVAGAALALGRLLLRRDESTRAGALLRQVADSGDPEAAPEAQCLLGRQAEGEGRLDEALAAYRRALDSGHHTFAPEAAVQLGFLAVGQEDLDGARTSFEYAVRSAHPPAVARGGVGLGSLNLMEQDIEGALAAFRQAIAGGSGHSVRVAATGMAMLFAPTTEIREVFMELQQVMNRNDEPGRAAAGAVLMGGLLMRREESKAAEALLRWAADSGQPVSAGAALLLGTLVADEYDDSAQAEALYRRALDADDARTALDAACRLGTLLAKQGRPEGEQHLRRAAQADEHPGAAAEAAAWLGLLLEERGDRGGALTSYRRAAEVGGDGKAAEFARARAAALDAEASAAAAAGASDETRPPEPPGEDDLE